MNKFIAVLFALSCFATAAQSSAIMGAGNWFWIIIVTGALVMLSQFIPKLAGAGSGIALLLSLISICAVLLGLVAATIGGSFKLDNNEALLLFSFALIAIFGFTLAIIHKKSLTTFRA